MKSIIIGATGLTGNALVRALERRGHETIATAFSRRQAGWVSLDVRDSKAVHQLVKEVRPEVIFVAVIAPGGVDFCENNPREAELLTVQATDFVLQAAKEVQAKVVYFSTDYIFDGTAGPYAEDSKPSPVSVYGRCKRQAEDLITAASERHLIIRSTCLFGWEKGSKNIAMSINENLIAGRPLRIPDDQWTNPTLADYLAEVAVTLIETDTAGVVNVVGKECLTRAEFAKKLAQAMGLDPELIIPTSTQNLKQTAARPLQGGLQTQKLEALLGTESLTMAESLQRFRRQYRADQHVTQGLKQVSDEAQQLKQEILDRVSRYHRLAHTPPPFIPYKSRVQYAGRVFGPEEMMNLVDSSLDFWLTMGPYGDQFERKMTRFFNARDFALINSGSTANLTAVMALMSRQLEDGLRAGDEVITTAVTFPTTLAPQIHGGLIPVIVDCEIGTYNINPALIEQALSPKTRAIMVPHTLGNPCQMDVLVDICKRHKLFLIEDCCDALGATFDGKLVGTFGDLGTLSFFPAHHITMGEGGGVIVNTPRLSRIVRSVRDWGRDCWCATGESNTCGKRFGWKLGELPKGYDHKYIYSNLGYNFKPTDMQAAIGVAQVDRLPSFLTARQRNFDHLYKGLSKYSDRLILPKWDPRARPSWFGFPITVTGGIERHALVHHLEHSNIETRQVFGGNILKQPGYQGLPMRVVGKMTETDRVMNDTFFIGVYPGLTDEMIDFVLEAFDRFFAAKGPANRAPEPLSCHC